MLKHIAAALFALAAALPAAAQHTTIVLVRHAEKAAAPADDPPLTEQGRARAADLAAALRDWSPEVVLVTPYARTRETAAPVAARFGIEPVLVPNSGTIAERAAALATIVRERYAGKRIVIVGHSNTIPVVIAALGGPKMPDLCDNEHSSLFMLELRGEAPARLVRSSYGAADPPPPAECARAMR